MNTPIKFETTYKAINEFNNLANMLLRASGDKMSPFLFAIKKSTRAIKPYIEEFQEFEQEQLLNYSAKDEKGYVVLETNKPSKMTPEDLKHYNQALKGKGKEVVEVETYQYVLGEIPDRVGLGNWDILSPFVLPELDDKLFEKLSSAPESK